MPYVTHRTPLQERRQKNEKYQVRIEPNPRHPRKKTHQQPGNDEQVSDEETNMAAHKLLLLPGDGIGPEVMGEVKRLIDWLNAKGIAQFETDQGLVGGSAYDAHKVAVTDETRGRRLATYEKGH